jgi:zinc/manganese transport system substrate-binding protein
MQKLIRLSRLALLLSGIAITAAINPSQADTLKVFACEPEWASLVKELGGERIDAFSATSAHQDPHHIEARPSLIARLRQADLLLCTGADLEVGWLPMLLRQTGNQKVRPDQPGYFEAAAQVQRLDIPQQLDRSMGDLHAAGNPHVHLDPRRIQDIAEALLARLIEIDPAGKAIYQQGYSQFTARWQTAIERWQQQAAPLKGQRIVVQHRDWLYLFDWLGVEIAGTLEPRPGLPTTAAHLQSLKKQLQQTPASMIVHAPHQSPRSAEKFAQLSGLPVLELPYTVGGTADTQNLFALFDQIIIRLTGATHE